MTFLAITSTTLFLAMCCLVVIVQAGGEEKRNALRETCRRYEQTIRQQAAELQTCRREHATPVYASLHREHLRVVPDAEGER